MTYQATEFYPNRPAGLALYEPTGPVECRVVRADLVGAAAFGARGIFHAGLLFSTPEAEWAIELTIPSFGELVPTVQDGKVVANNRMSLNYYRPLDAHLWRPYWTLTSDLVCTITPHQYRGAMKHVTDVIGPQFPYYVLATIAYKPNLRFEGQTGVQTTTVQDQDNTCDKLPLRIFEYLHSAHGVRIAPFPVTRIFVQITDRARKVAPDDPGLLAYARELDSITGALADLGNKNYVGALKVIAGFIAGDKVAPFRYFLGLDLEPPYAQSYYLVPSYDSSISISDVMLDLGPPQHFAEASGAAFSAIDDWSSLAETAGAVETTTPLPFSELVLEDGRSNPSVGRDSMPVQRQWVGRPAWVG